MIKVQQFSPPAHYKADVEIPGLNYLARYPRPTQKQFKHHKFWTKIHDDLYALYNGICVYCALWTPRRPSRRYDHTSVDHFLPRSEFSDKAYEWKNFRLSRSRLNRKKSNYMDVVDPFYIQNGWFIIDFATFLIRPDMSTPSWIKERVQLSINRLDLNHDDYVNERIEIITKYVFDQISISRLRSKYPFIALEFTRQNFDVRFKKRMRAELKIS